MKHLRYSSFAILIFALLAGCGDEPAKNNNTGPIKTCGAGTVLNPMFECVPDGSVVCSPGTIEVQGKCVADQSVCGEDTRWEDGKCVPDGSDTACGEGTTFVEGTGRCMPDVVCGAGTTAVGGKCLSDGEVLVADVDANEAAGENDPAFGGSPQALTMPAAGDSFLLMGTISSPAAKNGDGKRHQDVDTYSFEAQGSDFVRVHLRQVGVGSFGFEVRGPNGYYREGARNEAGPSRSLLLPAGGTYEIRVQPQATMFEPGAGPVGGEDHRYLLVLENVGGLNLEGAEIIETATEQSFSASFRSPEKQLARLLHPAQSAIRLQVEPGSGTGVTEAVLMVLDAQGKVLNEYAAGQTKNLMRASQENSRFLYVDYVQSNSLDTPVVVSTKTLETTPFTKVFRADDSGGLQAAGQLNPNAERYFSFEIEALTPSGAAVPQGMVVNFSLTRTVNRAAQLTVFTPDSEIVSTSLENRVLFYAEKPGVYLVEFKNLDELNSLSFSNLNVTTYLPVNLGGLNTGSKNKQTASFSVPAQGVQFFTYVTTEPLVSKVKIVPAIGPSPTWMELAGVDMKVRSSAADSLEIDRHVTLTPTRRVGTLFNEGVQRATGSIEVTASTLPGAESEPNDTRLQANVLLAEADKAPAPVHGTVQGTDVDYYKVRLNKRSLVAFETKIISGPSALAVQLLNAEGTLIELGDWRGDGIKVGAVLQADTDYYLSVATEVPASRTAYALFSSLITTDVMLEKEPNNQASQATLLLANAVEMIGTLGGYTDADWFELSLAQERWVKPVWRKDDAFATTHNVAELTFFAADKQTVLDFETMVKLPAGKSYVRVSTPQSLQSGNTYHLELETVDFESLGALTLGATLGRSNVVFTQPKQLVGYSFTVSNALPLDASQAVFAWSSEHITVFDAAGNAIYVARDSGQVFGSAADPTMYVHELAAGTYYVAIQRDFMSTYDLLFGQITHRKELEITGANSNNSSIFAEEIGTLVADEAVYIHASVHRTDDMDYFAFEVPGNVGDPGQNVSIELFRTGETVADVGLSLQNADENPLSDSNMTPQSISMQLEPGRYFIRAWFFDDVGFNSGDYLLRIVMEP